MINFFLNQHEGLTTKKRKLIEKRFLFRRKYNPFHLDCEYTKKKLCYCKKNISAYMTQAQKIQLWTNSYMKPYEFYNKDVIVTKNQKQSASELKLEQSSRHFKNHQIEDKFQNNQKEGKQEIRVTEKQLVQAAREFNICVQKIRALSREEVAKFVQQHSKKYRRAIIETADASMMLNQF